MKTIAIIQARMGSERLPGKVIMELANKPMIVHIYNRAMAAQKVDKVLVATTEAKIDEQLVGVCNEFEIPFFRGSVEDVLERFYLCAKNENPDIIVRLTGDNALIDPELIDKAIEIFVSEQVDYLHYCKELPLGMAIEVFTFSALEKAFYEAGNLECREHVTPYIYRNNQLFKSVFYSDGQLENHSDIRLTMDTENDFELINKIYKITSGCIIQYVELLQLLDDHCEWIKINKDIEQRKVMYSGE